jgi:hypothetical protein
VTDLLPGTAAIAYLLATLDDGQVWAPQATAGDVHVNDSAVNADRGTLGMMAEKSESWSFLEEIWFANNTLT